MQGFLGWRLVDEGLWKTPVFRFELSKPVMGRTGNHFFMVYSTSSVEKVGYTIINPWMYILLTRLLFVQSCSHPSQPSQLGEFYDIEDQPKTKN